MKISLVLVKTGWPCAQTWKHIVIVKNARYKCLVLKRALSRQLILEQLARGKVD